MSQRRRLSLVLSLTGLALMTLGAVASPMPVRPIITNGAVCYALYIGGTVFPRKSADEASVEQAVGRRKSTAD
jgi:hypothetical protein